MIDKTFLFLFIVFILVGLAAIQNHILESGKLPILTKIIDMAGLAKFKGGEEVIERVSKVSYKSDMENNIKRLSERYQLLEAQRNQLIYNRQAILSKLLEVTQDIQGEAQAIVEVIEQDRKDLFERFPDLTHIAESLRQARLISDLNERQQEYQKIEESLNLFLDNVVYVSEEQRQQLKKLFVSLKSFLEHEPDTLIEGCQSDLENCLPKDQEQLKDALVQLIEKIVNNPKRDEEKLTQLTQGFTKEIKLLMNNFEASENLLQENDAKIISELRKFMEKLVDVMDNDLNQLVEIYRKIEEEQEFLISNLEVNDLRLSRVDQQLSNHLSKVGQILPHASKEVFTRAGEFYRKLEEEKTNLVFELMINEKRWRDNRREQLVQTDRSVVKLAMSIEFELEKLTHDRKYQEKENQEKIKIQEALTSVRQFEQRHGGIPTGLRSQKEQVEESLSKRRAMRDKRNDDLNRQKQIKDQVDLQRQQLMDRARDMGF